MAADGARQELRPLGGLDRHAPRLVLLVKFSEFSPSLSFFNFATYIFFSVSIQALQEL